MAVTLELDPTTGRAKLLGLSQETREITQEELQKIFEQEELPVPIQNAINNLLRSGVTFILGNDAPGDTYFRSASGPLARLGIGANGQILKVNQGLPAWQSLTTLEWSEVTGTTQAAVANAGYIASNTALVTVTLPVAAAIGSIVEIAGKGAGGWRVAQGANQQVLFGTVANTTGTGGQLNSTHARDSIRLLCITADTTWQVISAIGNIDVV